MPTGEPAGSIPNVGLFEAAIKGKGSEPAGICRLWLFEKLIGSAAMLCSICHMLLDPHDLGLQQFNPFLQLIDRKGAKVLLRHLGQRVLRPAGKEVVLVHAVER